MGYKAVWLKGEQPIEYCEFDSFDDAKAAAEDRLANYRDLFGATATKVEDVAGNQVYFYCGGN